jgi:hypothetical protein
LIRRVDFYFIWARFSDGAPHGEELLICHAIKPLCHAIKPRRRPEKGKFGPIFPAADETLVLCCRAGEAVEFVSIQQGIRGR